MTFIPGKFYKLVDREGFVHSCHGNMSVNDMIADFIESIGNKFSVSIQYDEFYINEGDLYSKDSYYRLLDIGEFKYFEELPDDEASLKEPNVPYSYNENEIKDILKVAFEDEAFFEAFKLLPSTEIARILSLKFNGRKMTTFQYGV